MIDLDELERQLREAAAPRQPAPQVPGRDDPLAELARIVGQDDGARSSWRQPARPVAAAVEPPPPPAPAPRYAPADDFEAELAALTRGEPFTPPEPPMAPMPRPNERRDFDQDLAGWDLRPGDPAAGARQDFARQDFGRQEIDRQEFGRQDFGQQDFDRQDFDRSGDRVVAFEPHDRAPAYAAVQEAEPVYEAQGQLPPHDEVYEEIEPRPRRKGLYAVGTVLGVAAVGVVAALAMRSTGTGLQSGSAPPVIQADAGPMKARPENPGGVVVPNQDTAIFTRKPEDMKGAKMVGGEEQPVDVAAKVQQARAPAAAAPADPSSTTAALAPNGGTPASAVELPKPPQPTAAVPGLGEPRKVRTVSVRPDGTIIDAAGDIPIGRTAALAPGTIPSSSPPAVTGATPAPRRTDAVAPVAPLPAAPVAVTPPAPRPPAPVAVDAGATPAARPAPTPAPAAPRPAQVAAVAPAAPSGAAAPAAEAGGGGFTVQLAAPASEQEARDTAARLQRRFSGELGDLKPFVRRADVNGKTIYRVRVGNMTRDDATSLCTKVQSAGGQCFVARN